MCTQRYSCFWLNSSGYFLYLTRRLSSGGFDLYIFSLTFDSVSDNICCQTAWPCTYFHLFFTLDFQPEFSIIQRRIYINVKALHNTRQNNTTTSLILGVSSIYFIYKILNAENLKSVKVAAPWNFAHLARKFLYFIKTEGLFKCLQNAAIGPYFNSLQFVYCNDLCVLMRAVWVSHTTGCDCYCCLRCGMNMNNAAEKTAACVVTDLKTKAA